jgi:hypothetical protein
MLSIRIVTAGAVAAMAFVLAGASANAQTSASDQAGKPLSLLAGLAPPHESKVHEAKAHTHEKAAGRTIGKTAAKSSIAKNSIAKNTTLASKRRNRIALAQSQEPPAQPAPMTPPAAVWPLADAASPSDIATPTPSETAPPDNGTAPHEVVVGGQTVEVAAADQVNQIDLAAGDDSITAATPANKAEAAPAMQTVLTAPVNDDAGQNPRPISNASWFAQVLAALGGAFAAGTVAWFLIGSGPVRTDREIVASE